MDGEEVDQSPEAHGKAMDTVVEEMGEEGKDIKDGYTSGTSSDDDSDEDYEDAVDEDVGEVKSGESEIALQLKPG